MKAVVKYGNNPGELEIRDIPVPEIGEEDLLIQVKAAGICGSDLIFYSGYPLPVPTVLGHEFAGVIYQVGSKVKDWKVGDRVVSDNTGYACGKCYACATGQFLECPHRIAIGYGFDGGFAEFVKIPGDILRLNPNTLFEIPENVSFESATMLDPCANAYQALLQKSSFKAGDDVVIYGPGTIGLLCVQIARLAGANKIIVLGTERSKEKRFQIAKDLGATHTLISTKDNVIEIVKEALDNIEPRIIIDCAGSPNVLNQAIAMVAHGGEIIKIGFDHELATVDMNTLVLKGIKLIGNMGYNYVSWKNSISLLEKGSIQTDSIITDRLALEDFQKGFEMLFNKKAIKVILKP